MSEPRIGAVILSAGKGTRLRTGQRKVLPAVCGRPMPACVLDACREAGASRGPDTVIHPLAYIQERAQIGRRCTIGPLACVPSSTVLANEGRVPPLSASGGAA